MTPPELAVDPQSATAEELNVLVHSSDEGVLNEILFNPHLNETHIKSMLERLDLSGPVIEAIAGQTQWLKSEPIRFLIARHPHTPLRIGMASVKGLFLFDLVRVSLDPAAQAGVKRLAEEEVIAKVAHLPVGEKITLARRGSSRVAGALLAEGQQQAIAAALANPFLAESQILKVLSKTETPERVVAAIAQNPRWASHYNVRLALLRNRHTPLNVVMAFLPNLTMRDLKDISTLDSVSPALKAYLRKEVARRTSRGPGKPQI
jgi:hypothetical protein